MQIDRPCDSIHAWVPSDRGESLCPVAKKPISENGESDQALASIASENFGLSVDDLRTGPRQRARCAPAEGGREDGGVPMTVTEPPRPDAANPV